MTPEQRQAARERCEKATAVDSLFVRKNGEIWRHLGGDNEHGSDEDFDYHARTDLPAALDALDEADRIIADLEGAIRQSFTIARNCGCERSTDKLMTPAHKNPPLPSEKDKTNEKGRALLRIARELREFIDLSAVSDPDIRSMKQDIETVEEIGRWLSSVTPIVLVGEGNCRAAGRECSAESGLEPLDYGCGVGNVDLATDVQS